MLTWTRFLDTLLAKHRQMRATFGGSVAPDDLDAFVWGLEDRMLRLREALRDSACTQFLVVTRPELVVLDETARLVEALAGRDVALAGLVVNRLAPASTAAGWQQRHSLARHADALARAPAYGLPEAGEDPGGASLPALWRQAVAVEVPRGAGGRAAAGRRATGSSDAPTVEAPLPLPRARLVLVAGKGGVGKTTVACATALRLAADGRAVRLLSTDPAHSLEAVLETDVGAEPVAVAPGLTAQAVDAAARFEALRQTYVDEIGRLFDTTAPGLDLALDRAVMEGLMDLAPPGLDEVMAWDVALDALDTADVLVVDTAPTGHFLRLLEMPEHMRAWLRGFFRILRAYRDVLRLPALTDRLVGLSKQLRRLHEMLVDEQAGTVVAVATLERLALAETKALGARCHALGVPVHGLVLNQVARAASPAEPDAAPSAEPDLRPAFAEALPACPHAVVHRHPALRGPATLRALGQALYRAT